MPKKLEGVFMSDDASNRIAILVNPMTGEEFKVRRRSTSIGREFGNDVIISDRTLSRHHAVLQVVDEQFYLQDLESKNGTRLNGYPVSNQVVLKSGDEISVGLTRLIFLLIPARELKQGFAGSLGSGVATDPTIGDTKIPCALIAR